MEPCQNDRLGDGEALGEETVGLPDGLGEALGLPDGVAEAVGEALGRGSVDRFVDGLGFGVGVVDAVGEHVGDGLGLTPAVTRSRVTGSRFC